MNERTPKIEVFTEKSQIAADREGIVNVLVRISPPAHEEREEKRPKLNLSLVLDRSGSMQGPKMEQAKEAARYCVDQLLSSDRFSTVIFDDVVEILIPAGTAEDKQFLKRQISTVTARNSTALHEAWVRGGLEVSKQLAADAINRVLLITDGLANVGETNTDRIVTQAKGLFEKGISTSTIGIGADFNEDLLMPMAEAGGGNAWHVVEAADMQRIFAVELEGLLAQFGHSVTLAVRPSAGVEIKDALNDFARDVRGRYRLPNLQAGNALDVVLQVKVPASAAGVRELLATVELAYVDQETQRPERIEAVIEAEFADAEAVAALAENPDVAKAVSLLLNARARQEAMRRMDAGDYEGVQFSLRAAVDRTKIQFAKMPSADVEEELAELEKLEQSLHHRENDALNRKVMAYSADRRRKGR